MANRSASVRDDPSAEWDTCTTFGDCPHLSNSGLGRGQQPVIGVTWDDAQHYAAWRSKNKLLRLLDEADTRICRASALIHGATILVRAILTATVAARDGTTRRRRRSAHSLFAFGLYDMVATSGSGRKTVGTMITRTRRLTARHGSPEATARSIPYAAGLMSATRPTLSQPAVGNIGAMAVSTAWASALRERSDLELWLDR